MKPLYFATRGNTSYKNICLKTICSVLLLVTIAITAPLYAAEMPTEGLVFHAPFEESLEAALAANPAPKAKVGEYSFVPGKIGRAVRIGDKGSLLMYDGSTLNGAEGTVSLWVRPEWSLETENFHLFWTMIGDGQFNLYKHGSGKSLVFYVRGKGMTEDQATIIQTDMSDWKTNEWHHLAATWSAGNIELFVDGVLKKELTNANLALPMVTPNAFFFVGDYYSANYGTQSGLTGKADSDIDDLRIYNRALSPAEIQTLAQKETVAMTPPQTAKVVVPKTSSPPKIDGAFSFEEWKDAAGFSGFFDITTGKLTDKQTGVLLTYDDANLYVATFAPLLPGTQLQATANARDSGVYGDDSIEIYLDPAKARSAGKFVQFIGNSNGAILDAKDGDNNWNGNWRFKNGITNFQGLGVDYWVTEIALPFRELGRQTPKNGEEWAANFARTWMAGQQAYTSWAWDFKQQYSAPERFGTLEFRDDAPAFQWTGLKDLITGQPTIAGTYRGIVAADLQVSSQSSRLAKTDKKLPAGAQKAQPWTTTLDLASASSDTLKLEVRDKNRVLYSAELPYEIETQPLRVFVSPVPTQNRLLVDVDPLQFRKQWVKGWTADVQVQTKDAKVVTEKTLAQYVPPFARAEFDLREIPVGNYNIVVQLRDSNGKQVAEKTTLFTRPPAPEWVDNRIAMTDKVLPPWTPIVTSPQALKVWGREYSWGQNALPQQISSLGKPLLSAPMKLMVDGAPLPDSMNAKYRAATSAQATRVGASIAKNWKFDWTCKAEFDGVIWFEVTVSPQGAASQTLNSLALEIPLCGDTSTLYVTGDSGMGGEAGATPKQWQSSWKQGFWLGNENRGLSWFAESDQHWNLADSKRAITFDRNANQTLARINFVTKPLEISRPIIYRFGLLATPSRPQPKGWRGWQFSSRTDGTSINVDPERPTHALSWWMNWSPYISAPYDVLPGAKEIPAAFHKAGSKAMPYNALTVINDKARDFDYYRAEWLINPVKAAGGESGVDQQSWFVSPHSSYADYMLYALRQNVRNEKWDGFYFDFDGGALPDTNELHGAGYVNENGERRPTYDILAYRDFHKRLWAMLQDELKTDEPAVEVHNSSSLAPYIHSFANLWLDGEQFNFSPKVTDDYTKVLSRETFRAEFLGENFGSVVVLLPALGHLQEDWKKAPAGAAKEAAHQRFLAATDTLLLYPMMHGTLFLPAWLDMEYLRPLYEARHDLDMSTARFYGYWENANLVQLEQNNPDVLASIYAQDNRFWLVIGNWTDKEQNVTVDMAIGKIAPKLDGKNAKLKSLWKNGAASITGNQVQLSALPKSIRIVEISG